MTSSGSAGDRLLADVDGMSLIRGIEGAQIVAILLEGVGVCALAPDGAHEGLHLLDIHALDGHFAVALHDLSLRLGEFLPSARAGGEEPNALARRGPFNGAFAAEQ